LSVYDLSLLLTLNNSAHELKVKLNASAVIMVALLFINYTGLNRL